MQSIESYDVGRWFGAAIKYLRASFGAACLTFQDVCRVSKMSVVI